MRSKTGLYDRDQQTCSIGGRGENSLLWRLHLAPQTVADFSVKFQNGNGSEIYIALATAKGNAGREWQDDKGVIVLQPNLVVKKQACGKLARKAAASEGVTTRKRLSC